MTNTKAVKWKRIKDLRFYLDQSAELELREAPEKVRKGFLRLSHIVSQRFVARLIELELLLPGFDHIYVYLSTELQHGSFQYVLGGDDWYRLIHIGISLAELVQSPRSSWEAQLVNVMYACLVEFSKVYGLDSQKIHRAYEDLLRFGEKLEITHKCYKAKGLEATVSYTVGDITEVYLTWKLLRENRYGRLKVLSVCESRDVPHLVSKIAYSERVVSLIPKNSEYSRLLINHSYSEEELPIKVHIDLKTELEEPET